MAEQRVTWDSQAEERRKNAEREAAAMKAMLGGIDPSDPEAAEELAARLRRQEGWKRVEYRGDGLFDVEFNLTSRLDHDFVFPTLERFPLTNSFVLVHLREGRQVRVEAPGFAAQGAGGNPMQGMMTGMAGMAAAVADQPDKMPSFPQLDGTFRIVTDGRILANNTDEGPLEGADGETLEWRINARTQSPPTALVDLGS